MQEAISLSSHHLDRIFRLSDGLAESAPGVIPAIAKALRTVNYGLHYLRENDQRALDRFSALLADGRFTEIGLVTSQSPTFVARGYHHAPENNGQYDNALISGPLTDRRNVILLFHRVAKPIVASSHDAGFADDSRIPVMRGCIFSGKEVIVFDGSQLPQLLEVNETRNFKSSLAKLSQRDRGRIIEAVPFPPGSSWPGSREQYTPGR